MTKQSRIITFYFDPISPYVYMAFLKLPEFLKRNPDTQINYVPVLFAGLLNAHGQKGPAEVAAKRRNVIKDVLRFGVMNGIKTTLPPVHPYNPLLVLRILTALEKEEDKFKLATILLKASWEEGVDLSDVEAVHTLLKKNQFDSEKLFTQANDPVVKNKLKENTDKAIHQHVFGVPSFVIDDEVFWGHDRMDQLELYLKGELEIDQNLFRSLESRPLGVKRT